MVFGFCFQVVMFTYGASAIGVCNTATHWSLPLAGICGSLRWSVAHARNALSGCSSLCLEQGEPHATHLTVSQPFQLYGGAYRFWGLAESHLIPLPSPHGREGSSFQGNVPADDTGNSESVVGVKPGDSFEVIGYQVDEFTCTLSAEHLIAQSHIYPGFMGKMSTLTYFPLEPGCEDYSIWTRYWRTLSMVLMLFSWNPLTD